MVVADAKDQFDSVDDGTGIERNLGERYDGNEDTHQSCEGLGVTGRSEDVGGDGIADVIAEHEDAGYGCGGVEKILRHAICKPQDVSNGNLSRKLTVKLKVISRAFLYL